VRGHRRGKLTKEQRKVFDDSVRDDDNKGREQTFAEPEVEDLALTCAPPARARGSTPPRVRSSLACTWLQSWRGCGRKTPIDGVSITELAD
jgi:hypothetical protein